MNATLASRTVRYVSLAVVLVAVGTPAPADVITTGDVDPGGAGTQVDPWEAGAILYVGKFAAGTLDVEAGGLVSNNSGSIGYKPGASGETLVTGEGSRWNMVSWLAVGDEGGNGTLNVQAGDVVSNGNGFMGFDSSSTGVAMVT